MSESAGPRFRDRFTIIPDSGIVEMECFRCPGGSGEDRWAVGWHPSLDVLIEQARAHDLAKHGAGGKPAATGTEGAA